MGQPPGRSATRANWLDNGYLPTVPRAIINAGALVARVAVSFASGARDSSSWGRERRAIEPAWRVQLGYSMLRMFV